jgi:AraC family transcriptional regulator
VTKQYSTSTQYFEEVADKTSKDLSWDGLRLYQTSETSNDVTFENTASHVLTLELTGTSKHVTKMDGILEESLTVAGQVCRIPAGLPARFAWEVEAGHQQSIMVEFQQRLFEIYCPELASDQFLTGHLLPKNYSNTQTLSSLIKILSQELDGSTARGLLFAESAIRLLALEIAATEWSRRPSSPSIAGAVDPRINRAIEFIEANFRSNISLVKIAEISGLSLTRLIHLFQQQTRRTPYAFVIHQRIQEAIRLLVTTDLPLSHIAFDVGFSDQQHMNHHFRRQLKKTPMSFRRRGDTKLD